MKFLNNFIPFLKKELNPSPSRIIFALKVTLCACIGGSLAVYMNLIQHTHFGWWICSTIFSIPALTMGATVYKSIQRIGATIIGCSIGFLISFVVKHDPVFLLFAVAMNTFIWSLLKMITPKQEYTFVLGGVLCFMIFSSYFFNEEPGHVFILRFFDTLIGMAIVFLVFFIFWPSKHRAPRQIKEMNVQIYSKIALLYSERVKSYLYGGQDTRGFVPDVIKLNVDIIDKITILKQLENDLEIELFSKRKLNFLRKGQIIEEKFKNLHSLNCDKIFCLVNSLPISHTLEKNNLFFEPKMKFEFLEICDLTQKILASLYRNNEIINKLSVLIKYIKEERVSFFISKQHLKYPVEDNIKSYDFIHITEEIFLLYEKNYAQ